MRPNNSCSTPPAKARDPIVVEGQGAINHPAYAPVTLALMYGRAPDALILVCDPRAHARSKTTATPTLGYRELDRVLTRRCCATVKPARVIGIALNTRGLVRRRRRAGRSSARAAETGLPADDVVRFGAAKLLRGDRAADRQTRPAADAP